MSPHSPMILNLLVSTLWETLPTETTPILTDLTLANVTIYGIHTVGVFLPWHRYAIWVFESVLRSECNYTGAQPYWDWTLDNPSTNANGSIYTSPVLKAFGGDGSGTDGCIKDGPFAGNASLNIGPVESLASNPRCLTRSVDFDLFNGSTGWEDIYPATMEAKNYYQLQAFIDGLSFVKDEDKIRTSAFQSPHGLGHMAIGGDVRNLVLLQPFLCASILTPYSDQRYLLLPQRPALLASPLPARLHVDALAEPRPRPPD